MPAHVLKLAIVGVFSALAIGYGGAMLLDGIGLTPAPAANAQSTEVTPVVRMNDAAPTRIWVGDPLPAEPQQPVRTGALEPPIATGSLGDTRRQSREPAMETAPSIPAATPPAPEPAAAAAPSVEDAQGEPLNLGAGLEKVGALEGPIDMVPTPIPALAPAPAALPPARTAPSPLQNVELLDPAPAKPPPLQMPEERVIQIGPRKAADAPAADAKRASPLAAEVAKTTPDANKNVQKPRKTAKAKKRKSDDSFAQGVQDTLSMFGFD